MNDVSLTHTPFTRRCVHCGYNLHGNTSGVCPECGHAISILTDSPIPWEHRKSIGRARAMMRTVWLATAHPRLLAQAAELPIDYVAAQRFRRVVIAWVWGWASLFIAAYYISILVTMPKPHGPLSLFDGTMANEPTFTVGILFTSGYMLPPVPCVGVLIALALGTASAGFFARPKSVPMIVRNRAVALTRYTVAPLAWLPIGFVLLGAMVCTSILASHNFSAYWLIIYGGSTVGGLALLLSVWLYVANTLRV